MLNDPQYYDLSTVVLEYDYGYRRPHSPLTRLGQLLISGDDALWRRRLIWRCWCEAYAQQRRDAAIRRAFYLQDARCVTQERTQPILFLLRRLYVALSTHHHI